MTVTETDLNYWIVIVCLLSVGFSGLLYHVLIPDSYTEASPCEIINEETGKPLMEWEVKNYRQYIDCWNVECPQNMVTSMDDNGKCFCLIEKISCPSDIKLLVVPNE